MNKVKSFVKQFAAVIAGDDATAQGEKTLRAADSALKTQIASLKGDTIAFEDSISDAIEASNSALLNKGAVLTSAARGQYVQNLLNAENALTTAKENHEGHLAKIAFLEKKLEQLNEEVEA